MNDTKMFQQLQGRNFKRTGQREVIYSIFSNAEMPLTIAQIIEQLKKTQASVHRSTVYRTIKFMVEHEVVRELSLNKRVKSYELNNKPHHHYYVCEKCSQTIDIKPAEIEKAISHFESGFTKRNGHQIVRHSLKFFGTCRSCQA